jgi:hypothetical protein
MFELEFVSIVVWYVPEANLLFHPGLSTAEPTSNVSGRGVGMDVVKNNIEKIGGTVERFFRSRFGYTCAHEDSVDAGDYSR